MRLKRKYRLTRQQIEKMAVFLALNPQLERTVILEDATAGTVIARFFTNPRVLNQSCETSCDLDITDLES